MGKTVAIRNGTIVLPGESFVGDVLISGEKITQVIRKDGGVRRDRNLGDESEVDASGLYVLPGLIDAHVHYGLRARGTVTADDFETGSVAAACGGITAFVDFADQPPGGSLTEALRNRLDEAWGRAAVDYAFRLSVTSVGPGTREELEEAYLMGVRVLKVYTTYKDAGLMLDPGDTIRLLEIARDIGLLVSFHAEDDEIVGASAKDLAARGTLGPEQHAKSRPPLAEVEAIRKLIGMAEKTGCPVYFVHVSTAGGINLIREAKERGVEIYAETCPHYLLLSERMYSREHPQDFIMTPPLRTDADREELWRAVADGTVDVIATDHCAFTLEQKRSSSTCFDTLPGIPGSELMMSLVFTEAVKRGVGLSRLVQLLSHNPARIFGLGRFKGDILQGCDADICIADGSRESTVSAANLRSKAGYTPYEGMVVSWRPVRVLSRGRTVYLEGYQEPRPGPGRYCTLVKFLG